jgi:hypothetical protein
MVVGWLGVDGTLSLSLSLTLSLGGGGSRRALGEDVMRRKGNAAEKAEKGG